MTAPIRAVIYARYSTDMQNAASVADQERVCRERAKREGWKVERIYSDSAVSAASLVRPGIQSLLADLDKGGFEIVLAEALDRISRDQEDVAHVYKRAQFGSVAIHTLSEGLIGEIHIGLNGYMNRKFLTDLSAKTRRGQSGVAASGRIASGVCFGYEVVKELKSDGTVTTGLRRIREDQAAVVRRIFSDYISGLSAYTIARQLNKEGVPAPRHRWVTATIMGSAKRKDGLLNKDAYRGKIAWGKATYRKDPATGKRVQFQNPPESWTWADAPDLRIVDDATWNAAQEMQAKMSNPNPRYAKRAKHIFSGLVYCARCAGRMAVCSGGKIQCVTFKSAALCTNKKLVRLDVLENRILDGLQEELLSPEAIAANVKHYHEQKRAAAKAGHSTRRQTQKALTDVRGKIRNLVAAIEGGTGGRALVDRLQSLEAEEARLDATVKAAEADVIELNPAAHEIYRRQLEDLRKALKGEGAARQRAISVVRSMISRIVIDALADGSVEITVTGDIERIINLNGPGIAGVVAVGSASVTDLTQAEQTRPRIIRKMRA